MLRFVKHWVLVVLFVLFAGCSGGGCAQGCSCGGVTPLPAGFPPEKRVENAASVRLTDSGLGFLQDNLGAIAGLVLGDSGMGGIVTFPVPSTSQDLFIANADICPGGPNPNATPPECLAEIDIGGAQLQIETLSPHNIHVFGQMPVRIQKLPLKVTWFGFLEDNLEVVFNQGGSCPGADKPFGLVDIDVQVSIEIDADMTHSRFGYSKLVIGDVSIDGQDIVDNIEYCDQNGVTGDIIDALDDYFADTLADMIRDTLTSSLEDQLCQKANPELDPPCPDGTLADGDICRFGDGTCASIILGMEGNIDLGGFLAGISPGTKGAFDFLFAAGGHTVRDDGSGHHYGDLNPIGGGATLGLYGGTEPVPVSGCVTPVEIDPPSGIPIPDELVANSLGDWPAGTDGPHFGMAVSERFTNYMLTQLYNSGALCLGITADLLGEAVPLTTQLVSVALAAPSMKELGRMGEAAPLAILLRPQAPPQAVFGNGTDIETDPLIRLTLPQLSFDFYVWSHDRYIRMFTATMDLEVPMNIMVEPEGLRPVIESLTVSNASVDNAQLLREDPAAIAASLQALLGELVGGFLGDALPTINLNDSLVSLGLTLDIPPSTEQGSPGLRKLEKGRDRFLGIFGTIGLAPQMMSMAGPPPEGGLPGDRAGLTSDTTAELVDFHVDPEGLTIDGYTADNGPRARLYLGSSLDDGTHAIEWQYKLDKGPWHPFSRERWIDVGDEWLRAQGRHTIHVRSRVVGDVHSLDPEPARVELSVDGLPPRVRVTQNAQGLVEVHAHDAVSGDVEVRLRLGDRIGGEMAWDDWSEWMKASELAAFEPDAAHVEVEARDAEGHVAQVSQPLLRGRADGAGCECALPGGRAEHRWGWLFGAVLLGAVLWQRRRRRLPGRALSTPLAGAALVLLAGMSGCSCGDDEVIAAGCRDTGTCQTIEPGLIGSYTSAAVAADGTVWVSGYLEANHEQELYFGDLVVGRYNGSAVDWKVIDGVLADEQVNPAIYDPAGFRGGKVEPGDDVGLWTSLALDEGGNPAVAYYDATNKALKFAHMTGGSWSVTEVQRVDGGDVGRYAELLFVGGQPVIAYLFIEPGTAAAKSGVRLARASAGSWSFEDVVVDETTPCRDYLCSGDTACVASSGLCTAKRDDCSAECADGEECVEVGGMPVCEAVYGSGKVDTYPDAVGLYISAALRPDGTLGIAYYDRVHGNLVVATQRDGGWTPLVVDGESGGTDTGDKGIGASLFIDAQDNFHLAYVDGLSESLDYLLVAGGATATAPEIVDDGLSGADGPHLVGDDAHIVVTQGGEVRISYQDATSGQLKLAVGTASGSEHTWQVRAAEQEGFAGFFSRQLEVSGSFQMINWWRVASPASVGDVRLVSP